MIKRRISWLETSKKADHDINIRLRREYEWNSSRFNLQIDLFINDLDIRRECGLMKGADSTKLGHTASTEEG